MKKFTGRFCALFLFLFVFMIGYARMLHADLSSVGYIHDTILSAKNITVPVPENTPLGNPITAHYLMKQIDAANEIWNGRKISDYANDPAYASKSPVSAARAATDIDELIVDLRTHFTAYIEDASSFEIQINAKGTFIVDWGDGNIEQIKQNISSIKRYSHTYATTGNYEVKLGGKATAYDYNTTSVPSISFQNQLTLKRISGSLGKIFSTLPDGTQANFSNPFRGCTNLTGNIPAELFDGITGTPRTYMFYMTFGGGGKFTGTIPENLFVGLSGAPDVYSFAYTFDGQSELTGNIPANLFASIHGDTVERAFDGLFRNCKGLTGPIPGNLFSGIVGAPKPQVFSNVFSGCSGLSGTIPANLFAGISGAPAPGMFASTFSGCSNLTGNIPANLFSGINGAPATSMYNSTFSGCTKLTGTIPSGLWGTLSGVPAENMFYNTFNNCSGLSGAIPAGLFAGISGEPAKYMFRGTFSNCSGITSIPSGLFANISGTPAADMFHTTFFRCTGLKTIPTNLFGKFSGSPAPNMFNMTFDGCTNITSISNGIWDLSGLADEDATQMFSGTFLGLFNVNGATPTISATSTTKLWEHFTNASINRAFSGGVGSKWTDRTSIPENWRQ